MHWFFPVLVIRPTDKAESEQGYELASQLHYLFPEYIDDALLNNIPGTNWQWSSIKVSM